MSPVIKQNAPGIKPEAFCYSKHCNHYLRMRLRDINTTALPTTSNDPSM